ncbi:MAG: T9SS type A sorting domain-containing protein [candidate division Zixibacteria bacterium]|nr:T9SS type A sorting domain-containing protein [candidate division Zixibacteria bacterium]
MKKYNIIVRLTIFLAIIFAVRPLSADTNIYNDESKQTTERAALQVLADNPVITDTEEYCPSTYTNQTDDWITNVRFNTIDNSSGQDGPQSYGDYTDISTTVVPGETYTLTVTFDSQGQWTEHTRAWFDWNADEVFGVFESYYLGSGIDATLSVEVTVPNNAELGESRFRVIEQYDTDPAAGGACDGQGGHTATYGETEDYSIIIGTPAEFDASPTVFLGPTGIGEVGQAFTPIVTYSNLGSQTITFDINLEIELDGSTVYEDSGSIASLEPGISNDFEFTEYVPENPGLFSLLAYSQLEGDENPLNDMLELNYLVIPDLLPPANLTATGNQDGIVPLLWFEPGAPPCTLLSYDSGLVNNAFFYPSPENLIANMFSAVAPVQICTVFVRVLTEGDPYWPWPDDSHDPIEIRIWDGASMPENEIGYSLTTATPGEDIQVAFFPPLICNTNRFWVSFNNVNDTSPCDAICVDYSTNYPNAKWVREDGVWQLLELYEGDRMIRASIVVDDRNLLLTENNPNMDEPIITDTQELIGYNLYRHTEPGVPVEEAYRIVEEIAELEYDDEDVTNGTTYYYVATALYDDGDIIESAPSNEVSARPAGGGMLEVDPDEILAEVWLGNAGHFDLELINNGDLDVLFTIRPSSYRGFSVAPENPYYDGTISAKFSSNAENHNKSMAISDNNNFPPVITGQGGPDEFGYEWIDSEESSGPTFGWIDPSDHTPLTMADDDNQGPFALPFSFPFYGQVFSSFRVCSNGWISFTSSATAYSNHEIPGASVENLVAPFWDDLSPNNGGNIYWYANSNMAVISWVDVPAYDWGYGLGPFTFQIVLYSDGGILFQYMDMNEPLDHATIGTQDASTTIGLQIAFDQAYAYDGLAILIKAGWLSVDPIVGTVPAGGQLTVDVIMNTTNLYAGVFEGQLTINSNDINDELPEIEVPVTLDVLTDIDEVIEMPRTFALSQNYPNPFNASTSIDFALPEPAMVDLSVYNMLGQKVATLVSEELAAGYHCVNWDASDISSGIYFYKISAGDITEIHEMTLLK